MSAITVVAYTDGSSNPADRNGGWAVLLRFGNYVREFSGAATDTTNNRMELEAVWQAVHALQVPCTLQVHTDSQDVIGWLTGEFRQSNARVRELCQAILKLAQERKVVLQFVKVAGHAGDQDNERVDYLARMQRTGKYKLESILEG